MISHSKDYTMPRVFITSKGTHDYTKAEKFGQLVYLSEGTVTQYKLPSIARDFSDKLSDVTEDDFLLVSGLSSMNAVAATIINKHVGKVNYLLYIRDEYVVRTIKI